MVNEDVEKIIETIIRAKTPYEVLGINKDSSNKEIKHAYHQLAKIVHPDKCKHNKATECFQRISSAHILLLDSSKRKRYDNGEEEWMYNNKTSNDKEEDSPVFIDGIIPSMFGYEDDISPEEVLSSIFGDKNNIRNSYENRKFFSGKMKRNEDMEDNEKQNLNNNRFYHSIFFLIPIFISCIFLFDKIF